MKITPWIFVIENQSKEGYTYCITSFGLVVKRRLRLSWSDWASVFYFAPSCRWVRIERIV